MDNLNSPEYLEKIKISVIENIRRTGKPSGEQISIPGSINDDEEDVADDEDADLNADTRITSRQRDQHIEREDEFYSDNEMEEEGSGLVRAHKKPRILDGINPLAQPGPEDGDLPEVDDGVDVTMSGANGHVNEDEVEEEQIGNGALDDEESLKSESAVASPTSQAADNEDDEAGDRMDLDDEAEVEQDLPEDIAQSMEESSTTQVAPAESSAPAPAEPVQNQTPPISPTPPAAAAQSTLTAVATTEDEAEAELPQPVADVDMTGTGDDEIKSEATAQDSKVPEKSPAPDATAPTT
jgi:histone deacetylase 1/2